MEGVATAATGQTENLEQSKKKYFAEKNYLTETGLLMEGDCAQNLNGRNRDGAISGGKIRGL